MSTTRAGSTAAADAPPTNRRALATVVLVVFVDLVGFGIVIPILPFYVRSFDVSDVYIGLLAASYSLLQFGSAPLLGRVSDQYGRRPVLILSTLGGTVAWVVFGLAGSVAVLFAARMLAGAMGGNLAAAQAYVADVTPAEDRTGALGLLGAAFGLGFVVGPALGGLLTTDAALATAERVLPAAVPVTRFSIPSFAAAACSLLACGCTIAFVREPERSRGSVPTTWIASIREAMAVPAVRGYTVAFFLLSVAFSGVTVMFVPFAADVYGYTAAQVAWLLAFVGVLGIVNQGVLVGRLSRRYSGQAIAGAGTVSLLGALGTLPFAPALGRAVLPAGPAFLTPEVLALLVVLAGLSLGNALLSVALTALVSTASGAAVQGSAFGITQGAASLGRTVGPPVMAALYLVGIAVPFLVGAALLVPVYVLVRRG